MKDIMICGIDNGRRFLWNEYYLLLNPPFKSRMSARSIEMIVESRFPERSYKLGNKPRVVNAREWYPYIYK